MLALSVVAGLGSGCTPEDLPGSPPAVLARCAPLEAGPCTVHLEVEDFVGEWDEQRNLRRFYGRGFRVSNAEGVAESTLRARIDVPEGTYRVFTRGYVDGDRDRRWRLVVDGRPLADTHARVEGADGAWVWAFAEEVEVPGGEVDLVIEDRGGSNEVADAIVLTTDPAVDPARTAPAVEVRVPEGAERATLDELAARAARYAAAVPAPEDAEGWRTRREALRPRVLARLGLDPDEPKTPLDADVLGSVDFDGYRVERVVFHSRPGMPVPAHVFVPDGAGPFPAMVHPIGHDYYFGKMRRSLAARAHGLAKQGVLSLIYDAFGQAERRADGHNHDVQWRLSLTGRTNMTLMVWDTVRAIDYLRSRADVRGEDIGVSGWSGGGLNALYTSVFDPRVALSAPVAAVVQIEELIGSRIVHGACATAPGLGGFTNAGEIAGLFAPRPQLIMAAAQDRTFPIEATRPAGRQAEANYAAAGVPQALRFEVFEGGHAYARAMRERLYGFVAHHLQEAPSDAPIPEPALSLPSQTDERLFVFEGGRLPEDVVSPNDLALKWADEALAVLPGPDALDAPGLRGWLQESLRGRVEAPAPTVQVQPPLEDEHGRTLERWSIEVAPGLALPAVLQRGRPGRPVVVVVDATERVSPVWFDESARQGVSVLHVSLRGWGPLVEDERLVFAAGALLGDPIVGTRALDLVAVRAALRSDPELSDSPALLVAAGLDASLVGLYAQAAFAPFEAAVIGPMPSSYRATFDLELPRQAFVFGILEHADFPQLARLAAERPLAWVTDWEGLHAGAPEWGEDLEGRGARLDHLSTESALRVGLGLLEP